MSERLLVSTAHSVNCGKVVCGKCYYLHRIVYPGKARSNDFQCILFGTNLKLRGARPKRCPSCLDRERRAEEIYDKMRAQARGKKKEGGSDAPTHFHHGIRVPQRGRDLPRIQAGGIQG